MKVSFILLLSVAIAFAMPSDLNEDVNLGADLQGVQGQLQGGISAAGLQKIIDHAIPIVISKVKGMNIPGESGKDSGFKWSVDGITVQQLSIASQTATVSDGVGIAIGGLHVAVHIGSIHYKKSKFPWIPRGSMRADVKIDASNIAVKLAIVPGPNGRPQLTNIQVQCNLNNVSIKTHGSIFSWLYNLVLKAFKGKIKHAIEGAIVTGFTQALHQASNVIINTMPTVVPVSKWGTMNLGLTATSFAHSTAMLAFNGEVYPITTNTTDGAFARAAIPFNAAGRHISGDLGVFVFNTAARSFFRAGELNRAVDDANKPADIKSKLVVETLKAAVPELAAKHPNGALEIRVTLAEPPVFGAAASQFSLSTPFFLDFYVKGTSFMAFRIKTTAGSALRMNIENRHNLPHFVPQIAGVSLTSVLVKSEVGTFDVKGITDIVSGIVNFVAVPILNQKLLDGFPLPAVAGMSFVHPEFTIGNGFIHFASDISYKPPAMLTNELEALQVYV